MERKSPFFRKNWPALLLTAGVFLLTFLTVLQFRTVMSNVAADYLAHSLWAVALTPDQLLSSFWDGSEHLWHVCVNLCFRVTGNMWTSAAIVTAGANAAAYLVLFLLTDRVRPEKLPSPAAALLLFSVFAVSALWLPGASFYADTGSVNTWHNPTNIMVRPFALAVFYMTVRMYDRRRGAGPDEPWGTPAYKGGEIVLYPLCILLSVYAKPSFLQFFAPAILLFLLWDVFRTKGRFLLFCLKLALAYLPAGLILLSQFSSFFGGGVTLTAPAEAAGTAGTAAGVAVYFLEASFDGAGAFFRAVGDLICRILRLSAFPLFILCLSPGAFFRNASGRLGFTCAAVGRLESLLLHETGSRANHGNFQWGQYLSAWLLWCAAMERFTVLLREDSRPGKLARWIGSPLLAWHLLSGAAYLAEIWRTGLYFI